MQKNAYLIFSFFSCLILFSFNSKLDDGFLYGKKGIESSHNLKTEEEIWYICIDCCKTKKAGKNTPWVSGCRGNSSGMHTYWFCGNAGDYNWTCRNCDAEVYLSASPSASKCCAGGGSHSWYHK